MGIAINILVLLATVFGGMLALWGWASGQDTEILFGLFVVVAAYVGARAIKGLIGRE